MTCQADIPSIFPKYWRVGDDMSFGEVSQHDTMPTFPTKAGSGGAKLLRGDNFTIFTEYFGVFDQLGAISLLFSNVDEVFVIFYASVISLDVSG